GIESCFHAQWFLRRARFLKLLAEFRLLHDFRGAFLDVCQLFVNGGKSWHCSSIIRKSAGRSYQADVKSKSELRLNICASKNIRCVLPLPSKFRTELVLVAGQLSGIRPRAQCLSLPSTQCALAPESALPASARRPNQGHPRPFAG